MRIVHLVDYYQPEVGYQEVHLSRKHQQMGHDVLVVTSRFSWPFIDSGENLKPMPAGFTHQNGVQVRRLSSWVRIRTRTGSVIYKKLYQALRDFSPEVVFVHTHNPLMLSTLQAALLKPKLQYKLVMDSHISEYNMFFADKYGWQSTFKRLVYHGFRNAFASHIVKQMDGMIAIGEPEQKNYVTLLNVHPQQVKVIRLGADVTLFRLDASHRSEILQALGWVQDVMVVGHVGIIWQEKGVNYLLKVVADLRQQFSKLRVLLVGRPTEQYAPILQNLISEYDLADIVHVSGFVDRQQLPKYLSAIDVGVWPKAITISAIETMSCKTPIIALKTPYTKEIIGKFDAGILIDESSRDIELHQSLRSLLEKDDLRTQLGQNAALAVQEELNWAVAAEEFIKVAKD